MFEAVSVAAHKQFQGEPCVESSRAKRVLILLGQVSFYMREIIPHPIYLKERARGCGVAHRHKAVRADPGLKLLGDEMRAPKDRVQYKLSWMRLRMDEVPTCCMLV